MTRPSDGGCQIAVVISDLHARGEHVLPMGKVRAADKTPQKTALREVREKTGYHATLGDFAGLTSCHR